MALLILLQSRRVVKAADVAEKFEVSLRTVYRDIQTLYNAGIPIIGEAGVGYSIVDGYRLPPVMFDDNEALALLTAEKFIGTLTDEQTEAAYQSAMNKIRAVLGSQEQEALEIVEDSISIPSPRKPDGSNYLQEIFRGVADRKVIRLQYQKVGESQASDRMIEPLGCYYHFEHWYLIAYCRLKNDYRTFKNERIQSLRLQNESFENQHPSLDEYLEKEAKKRKSEMVVVSFDQRTASFTGRIKHSLGWVREEKKGDRLIMTFLTPSAVQMGYWLLSFTNMVEIIQPESLKHRMRELVVELQTHYAVPEKAPS